MTEPIDLFGDDFQWYDDPDAGRVALLAVLVAVGSLLAAALLAVRRVLS